MREHDLLPLGASQSPAPSPRTVALVGHAALRLRQATGDGGDSYGTVAEPATTATAPETAESNEAVVQASQDSSSSDSSSDSGDSSGPEEEAAKEFPA